MDSTVAINASRREVQPDANEILAQTKENGAPELSVDKAATSKERWTNAIDMRLTMISIGCNHKNHKTSVCRAV